MQHLAVYVIETEGDKPPLALELIGEFKGCECVVKRPMGWSADCTDDNIGQMVRLFFGINHAKQLMGQIRTDLRREMACNSDTISKISAKLEAAYCQGFEDDPKLTGMEGEGEHERDEISYKPTGR